MNVHTKIMDIPHGVFLPSSEQEKAYLASWALERLNDYRFATGYNCVAIFRNDQLACVCVYHNARDGNVEIALASDNPRWATRKVLSFLMWIAFVYFGYRRVTALCKAGNARVRKLNKGIGFMEEGFHRQLFSDDDGYSYGMTRDWFLRSKWA